MEELTVFQLMFLEALCMEFKKNLDSSCSSYKDDVAYCDKILNILYNKVFKLFSSYLNEGGE